MAATGMFGLVAVTWKPGGVSTTESPWLIQHPISDGRPENSEPRSLTVRVLPPYSARPVRETRPPFSLAMSCRP